MAKLDSLLATGTNTYIFVDHTGKNRVVKIVPFPTNSSRVAFATEVYVHDLMTRAHPNMVVHYFSSCIGPRIGEICIQRIGTTLMDEMHGVASLREFHLNNWPSIKASIENIVRSLNVERITHRDMNPGNLACIKNEGTISLLLLDFGCACGISKEGWPWGATSAYPTDFDIVFFIIHYERACIGIGTPITLSAFEMPGGVDRARVETVRQQYQI